ncbi:ricin-type beta-trefoil lectin domain protein [Pseudorhodobacter sp. E13]|uniref:ricin-type beta-trefoil lectin domain protein n=1 Tax=Pseudorhodobacter sp. E13 TaxID=2487931 RepID=UPI00131509B5|nr:ricin-type beta-trefoil lectin domain protein [Pseudorhodobacter sp. E13]
MFSRCTLATLFGAVLIAGTAMAEPVEIYLTDMLDNTQNGYCLDIARAQGAQANPDDGLQGHTCYSPLGELMVDQIFDSTKFADGQLYMPEFDVCALALSSETGSTIDLAACDGSAAQGFVFSGNGTITPASAPDMCLTVAEDTRSGRSDANQIKALTLEPCDASKAAYQTWSTRTAS